MKNFKLLLVFLLVTFIGYGQVVTLNATSDTIYFGDKDTLFVLENGAAPTITVIDNWTVNTVLIQGMYGEDTLIIQPQQTSARVLLLDYIIAWWDNGIYHQRVKTITVLTPSSSPIVLFPLCKSYKGYGFNLTDNSGYIFTVYDIYGRVVFKTTDINEYFNSCETQLYIYTLEYKGVSQSGKFINSL